MMSVAGSMGLWILTDESFYLGGIFAFTAIAITAQLIYGHLKSYTCPSQVKHTRAHEMHWWRDI